MRLATFRRLLYLSLVTPLCFAGEIDFDRGEALVSSVTTDGVDLFAGEYPDVPAANTFAEPGDNAFDLPAGLGRWYRYRFVLPDEYSNLTLQLEVGVNDEFALFINGNGVAMQTDTDASNFNDPFPGFVMFEDGAAFDNSGAKLDDLREDLGPVFQPGENTLTIYATDTVADGSFFQFDADFAFDNPFRPNAGINDAWYNPRTSGQGILFTYYPEIDRLFGAWFTFDTERPPEDLEAILGEPGHRWVTMQGPGPDESDTAVLTLNNTVGGVFDSGDPSPETTPVGSVEVFWHSCTHAHVRYDLLDIDEDDDVPLRRIVSDNIALCEALKGE